MKFREYLKDHGVIIAVDICAIIAANIFMAAFKVQSGLQLAVTLIFALAFLAGLSWDYMRKNKYYNTMQDNLRELDRKFLIIETLEEPDFYEGKMLNDTIREMGKSMYEHVARAKRYTADFKDYIEMWVHEVKLPVAGLLLRINNLKERIETEAEETDYDEMHLSGSEKEESIERRIRELREAEGQLKRINDYIEQVLYYSRSENAEKDYIIRDTKLGRAVSSVLSANRSIILERNITLNVHDLDRTVVTDGKWLEFIMGQFLSNSIRYTSEEKEPLIEIYSEEENGKTVLHFRDNGTGIPEQDMGRIWDKAFTGSNGRIDTADEKGHFGSTGMGLYMVKKLCDKLGHRAEVRSDYGKFTDFMVIFGKNDIYKV